MKNFKSGILSGIFRRISSKFYVEIPNNSQVVRFRDHNQDPFDVNAYLETRSNTDTEPLQPLEQLVLQTVRKILIRAAHKLHLRYEHPDEIWIFHDNKQLEVSISLSFELDELLYFSLEIQEQKTGEKFTGTGTTLQQAVDDILYELQLLEEIDT